MTECGRVVAWDFVRDAFFHATNRVAGFSFHVTFGSMRYYLPDHDTTLRDVIATFVDRRPPYIADVFDCNDFALALAADAAMQAYETGEDRPKIPMAIVTGILNTDDGTVTHAMNMTMDCYDRVWWIEPQIVNADMSQGIYPADEIQLDAIFELRIE